MSRRKAEEESRIRVFFLCALDKFGPVPIMPLCLTRARLTIPNNKRFKKAASLGRSYYRGSGCFVREKSFLE